MENCGKIVSSVPREESDPHAHYCHPKRVSFPPLRCHSALRTTPLGAVRLWLILCPPFPGPSTRQREGSLAIQSLGLFVTVSMTFVLKSVSSNQGLPLPMRAFLFIHGKEF